MNVKNRSVIRRLSFKTLWASRKRNLIAIAAIALTALLFTSLFTIAMSVNDGFQQSNFRQVGGYSHGGFKYLSQEQFLELRDDPLIKQWGLRRFLGIPREAPFHKSHVEIGFADENWVHWGFCDPIVGRLPQEGTDEAAADLKVLALLGIAPELGAPFTITFDVDGHETTQTFTLCGWWEADPVAMANNVLIPESRVNAILDETGVDPANTADGMTGSWNLDVMLGSSLHIEKDLLKILANHGYEEGNKPGQIPIGVNWGYSGSQLFENMDAATLFMGIAGLALIIFTGYLIIYNIFRISVTGDIRFYGLLKTIGTTPRQLKRIIRYQALSLSLCGIPLGLLLGWLVGAALTPVVIGQLSGVVNIVSASPVIFLGAAVFALVTVLLSCGKPGRMAAKVSPVEAIRYTEAAAGKRKSRASSKRLSLLSMAWANLSRSPIKTALTVASLCLAVVLLSVTVTFTGGFDMDKYLRDVPADFIVADASYFQTGNVKSYGIPQEMLDQIAAAEGVTRTGKAYATTFSCQEFITEDWFRQKRSNWGDEGSLQWMLDMSERNGAGLMADGVQLYGMESPILDKLTVLEGDLAPVYEPGTNAIAAVYHLDDYDKPHWDSNWAKVGDTVTVRYIDEVEYYDPTTGEAYPEDVNLDTVVYWYRAKVYHDETYTVAALVAVPSALSYRYYGSDEFILNEETFRRDSGTNDILYCAFDMDSPEAEARMESWLRQRTENASQDYESKATYVEAFTGMRNMFGMLGGALSFIVGLVGVLNFFNTTMTGILSRQREFAVLQAVGMTGRQLKAMLVWEGLLYTLGAALAALVLAVTMNPMIGRVLEKVLWFYTAKTTLWPVLAVVPVFALLGWMIPAVMYGQITRQSVVERLREAET